jgi:histidinol-phosphate phosphatase family domain/HAD-superfamily hydrolase, subfamily IIIA
MDLVKMETKFMTKNKLCLLDRDGVLNVDKDYLYKTEDVEWLPGSREAIAWLNRQGFRVVVVTNQSGVARGYFTESTVRILHDWIKEEVKKAGGEIAAFYYCPHLPGAAVKQYDVDCACRKPKPGMVVQALRDFDVLPWNAFLVGDSSRDIEAAKAAGVKGFLYTGGSLLGFVQKIVRNVKV